jgi:hypothetical protein
MFPANVSEPPVVVEAKVWLDERLSAEEMTSVLELLSVIPPERVIEFPLMLKEPAPELNVMLERLNAPLLFRLPTVVAPEVKTIESPVAGGVLVPLQLPAVFQVLSVAPVHVSVAAKSRLLEIRTGTADAAASIHALR